MKTLNYYLIIEELPEETKRTNYGLELGDAHREDIRYRKGRTVSIGDLITQVEKDDLILFDKNAGHNVDIGDETFKVITIRDVLAVL